jgi:serpin B
VPQPAEAREAAVAAPSAASVPVTSAATAVPSAATVPAAAATSVTSAATAVPAAAAATSDSGQADGLSAGNNQFAFELLQQLHKANPQENIIYSPFSVSTALSMTYAGARANTAGQMAAALHFGSQ